MTINELRNAPAQTKQYLDAQLLAIGPAKVVNTPRGQRNVQELQVVDRQGVQEKIAYWYDTDKPDFAMPPQQVNQWLQWVVKTKPNGQYLNISGYPEKAAAPPQQATQPNAATQAIIDSHRPQPAVVQQPPAQQQPYNPPPQAAPQAPDWDKIAEGKVRCNLVCSGVQSGQIKVSCEDDFEGWMNYIFNGVQVPGGGVNPDYDPNPAPTGPGSDVPF